MAERKKRLKSAPLDARQIQVVDPTDKGAKKALKRASFTERKASIAPNVTIDFSFINRNYEMLKKIQETPNLLSWVRVRRFARNRLAMFALFMLIVTLVLCIIMPFTTLSPTRFYDVNHAPPLTGDHILGTDLAGRDIWARLWSGLRFSFGLAAVATTIDIILGVTLGLFMGYFAWFDRIMQYVMQFLTVIPNLFVLTLIVIFFQPSFEILILGMIITGWISMAQVVRSEVIRLKSREYTIAERAIGTPSHAILRTYLPMILPMIFSQLIFTIPSAFLFDSSLAFLGLSRPDMVSTGIVINDASAAATIYPLEIVFPILPLISILIYTQFIGNALDDVLSGVTRD